MVETRDQLVYALTLAAELEHHLCCQYLFAGYSLKKRRDEGLTEVQLAKVRDWQTTIFTIARQEMAHLGIVNNLLTAIGASPHFWRPNLPQPAETYGTNTALKLERFGHAALDRFIAFERPRQVMPVTLSPVPKPFEYDSIHSLYQYIERAFEDFSQAELFIGPPDAQMDNQAIGLAPGRHTYDVMITSVTDRDSALAAIRQIMLEGEGRPENCEVEGHFEHFQRLKDELALEEQHTPGFEPARAVIDDPITRAAHLRGSPAGNLITHPETLDMADLWNGTYETLLKILIRFYAHTDETKEERHGLQRTGFFPLMTMALRPLAEMLTRLPVDPDPSKGTAGPSFEFYRSIQFLPDKRSAWCLIHEKLQEVAHFCGQLSAKGARYAELSNDSSMADRLQFTYENLTRIADNFRDYMEKK